MRQVCEKGTPATGRRQIPQVDITLRSHDGTRATGTPTSPHDASQSAVLVHGGGVTRDEGGFYVRLADALAVGGIASLRFDLRGHGTSGGRQEELTPAAAANDVRAAIDEVHTPGVPVTVVGTSFSGGVCALVAAAGTPGLHNLAKRSPGSRAIEDLIAAQTLAALSSIQWLVVST